MNHEKVLIVSHDIGAANIINENLKKFDDIHFYCEGPALKLFKQNYPNAVFFSDLEAAFNNTYSLIITGTGYMTSLEHSARKIGLNKKFKTVAVIDHWINYESRFIFKEEKVLPNEIWVGDSLAFEIASNTFPKCTIKKVDSYYKKIVNNIKKINNSLHDILYLSEPLREPWAKTQPEEIEALLYFYKLIKKSSFSKTPIRLRLHPTEETLLYKNAIQKHQLTLEFDPIKNLEESIANADLVIGLHSSALAIATDADKKVYHAFPDYGVKCKLPHAAIKPIKEIDSLG